MADVNSTISIITLNVNGLNNPIRDFPGRPVVKNLPSNARDAGSTPGRGTEIPHAVGQLSLHAATTEPAHRNYRAHVLWSPCATTKEKPACRNEDPAYRN